MLGPIGKLLIALGAVAILVGVLFLVFGRLGIGRLPGDISFQRGRVTIFFPVVTCLVVSLALSLIMSFIARWRR
jgi:hypothetical protein